MTLAERRAAEDAFRDALYQARVAACEAGMTSDRQEQLLHAEAQHLLGERLREQREEREQAIALVFPVVLFLSGGVEPEPLIAPRPPAPAAPPQVVRSKQQEEKPLTVSVG